MRHQNTEMLAIMISALILDWGDPFGSSRCDMLPPMLGAHEDTITTAWLMET